MESEDCNIDEEKMFIKNVRKRFGAGDREFIVDDNVDLAAINDE